LPLPKFSPLEPSTCPRHEQHACHPNTHRREHGLRVSPGKIFIERFRVDVADRRGTLYENVGRIITE
jgi:hypothetical protein